MADGLAHLEPLVGVFEAKGPSRGLAGVLWGLARLYAQGGQVHVHEVLALQRRAAEIARLVGDDSTLAVALVDYGGSLLYMGRDEEALPLLHEAGGLAEAIGDLDALCSALLPTALIHMNRGAFADCSLSRRRPAIGSRSVQESCGRTLGPASLLMTVPRRTA